jgi:polar amino acid transport system substrate-binding protein
MRKATLLVVVLLSLALILTACGGGKNKQSSNEDLSWQKIKDTGELVIGLDDNFPPIGFRDADGNLVGSDIDMAAAACEKLGVKPVFKPVEWDGVLLSLKNGDIDVIWNALSITPQRAAEINFSRAYMNVPQTIYVQIGSEIKEKNDLKGKIIGVQLNSSADTLLADDEIFPDIKESRKYGSYIEAFIDLQNGRNDAVMTDVVNGQYLISLEKMDGFFEVRESINFGDEPWAVGVRKGDDALQAKINEVLDQMKADGTSGAISQKWFNLNVIY